MHGKTISQTFLFPCTLRHHMWGLEESLRTSATDFKPPNNSTAGVPSLMISAQAHVTAPGSGPQPRQCAGTLQAWTPSIHSQLHLHFTKEPMQKASRNAYISSSSTVTGSTGFPHTPFIKFQISRAHKKKLLKKITASLSDPGLETENALTALNCITKVLVWFSPPTKFMDYLPF